MPEPSLAPGRPDDLAALTIEALIERTGIDPDTIDDVLFGLWVVVLS